MPKKTDTIFANEAYPPSFVFDEKVARVFDDMLRRSIPLYRETTQLVCSWAQTCWQPGTRLYDVGCSTGETLLNLAHSLPGYGHLVGIDNSQPMIKEAKLKVPPLINDKQITFDCSPAEKAIFKECSFAVSNFTLQFLPVEERQGVLTRLYSALSQGGILFLSEKLKASDPWFEEQNTVIYEAFKTAHGYSPEEIHRKKMALASVLIPLTLKEQESMIKKAGFQSCEIVLKWHNFVSLVARK